MFYFLGCILIFFIADLIFNKIVIEDREHVPRSGGYIIAANHVSYLDPVAIGYAVWRATRRPVNYIAKIELAGNEFFKWFFKQYHVIFIKRREGDRSLLNQVIDLLKQNQMVLIFPQQSSNPEKQELKSGVGLLARNSQKQILPVKIEISGYKRVNGFWCWSKMILCWLIGPGKIKVKFGSLMNFDNTVDRWRITNRAIEKINSL